MFYNAAHRKILAAFLAFCVALNMSQLAEASALAKTDGGGSISAFEKLPSSVSSQTAALGTSQSGLNLPDTLTVAVRLKSETVKSEPASDSGESKDGSPSSVRSDADSDGADGQQTPKPESTTPSGSQEVLAESTGDTQPNSIKAAVSQTITKEIPVTWVSTPGYDGTKAGTYKFTPVLPDGYSLTDGVEFPEVIVTVKTTTVKINLSSVASGGDGYTYSEGTVTIKDSGFSYEITGSTKSSKIVVNAGTEASPVNITLDGAKIDVSSFHASTCAFELNGTSAVSLTLRGANTLKSNNNCAGLQVPAGTELTVDKGSTGSLDVIGSHYGAGIGGGYGNHSECGTVTISGGTITATGGSCGAGLGGGFGGSGGIININGGNVTATTHGGGAGIGGGVNGSGGTITISGGNVTAIGSYYDAGIGGGTKGNGDTTPTSGGTVTISGGSVAAQGIGRAGISSSVTDGNGHTEYLTKVTVGKDAVRSKSMAYTVDGGNEISTSSDKNGLLYLWLTKGEHILKVTAAGKPYSAVFSVSDTNRNSVTAALDSERKTDIDISKVSSGGDGFTYTGNTVTIRLPGTYTFTGSTKSNEIAVSAGTEASPVNITLDGAKVDVSSSDDSCAFKLKGSSSVNLTLKGVNTLKSGKSCAGLQAPDGTELTVTNGSTGSLDTIGGSDGAGVGGAGGGGAGIGGGSGANGGAITINGGTVSATGVGGAGIGGGSGGGDGGAITINGGTVSATGGGGAGIGGGVMGKGGNVTIRGGTVTAKGGSDASGIGAGRYYNVNGSCVITGGSVNAINGNLTSPGIPSGVTDKDGNHEYLAKVTVGKDAVKSKNMTYTADGGNKISTSSDDKGMLYLWLTAGEHTLAVSAEGKPYSAFLSVSDSEKSSATATLDSERKADIDLTKVNSGGDGYTCADNTVTIRLPGAYTFTGSTSSNKIAVSAGTEAGPVNIILDGAHIDVSSSDNTCAFELKGSSAVNLTLKGINTLKSGTSCPGLQSPDGTELTVTKDSTGSLNATGGSNGGTGIGSGYCSNGGNVTINGGTVTAKGGKSSAGIGGGTGIDGGVSCNGGTVTINGGTVTATGNYGAGIGGGYCSNGGSVTINGGTVTATGNYGAGIGGGVMGKGGSVTIRGGTVTAKGGSYAAGIGAGANSTVNGSCVITGGSVNAVNGDGTAPGIPSGVTDGSGNAEYLDTVTIRDAVGSLFSSRILEYIAVENGLGVNLYKDGRIMASKGAGITVSTDTAGKLYLWLPAGNAKLSFTSGKINADISGLVGNDNKTAMTAWLGKKPNGSSSHTALPSTLTDTEAGVEADISGATFPPSVDGVTLSATRSKIAGASADPQGTAAYWLAVSSSALNIIGSPMLYNLKLLDQSGNTISSFSGNVAVKLPVPAGIHGTLRVFRCEPDGTFTDMDAKEENGYLVFSTTHFSYYILAGTGDSITLDTKSYEMPVSGKYQIGVKITGKKNILMKVHSTNGKTAAAVRLANGNVQVSGKNPGTAWIMFDVYDDRNRLLAHVSTRVDVRTGIRPRGDSTRQIAVYTVRDTEDSLTLDTTSYEMPAGDKYQIGAWLTGGKAVTVRYYSANDRIASVTKLSSGNYQVTGNRTGTTWIMFDVYDKKNKLLTHVSTRIDVKNGIQPKGYSAKQIGVF